MSLLAYLISSIGGWTTVAISLLLSYALLVAYRLFLHPLARFPGPRIAAASQWCETYYELLRGQGGQFPEKVRELHRRYGPIIRINPQELSVEDVDFHAKLYASQPAIRDKWAPLTAILGTTVGTFSTVEHNLHRKRRFAVSPFFSIANINAAEPLMQHHIKRCCELIWSLENEVIELCVPFAALMFDTMFDMAFGGSLNSLGNLDVANQWDLKTDAISAFAPWLKSFPWSIQPFLRLPLGLVKRISKKVARILLVNHRIKEQTALYFEEGHDKNAESAKQPERPESYYEVLLRRNVTPEGSDTFTLSQEGTELFAASATPVRVLSAAMFYIHDSQMVLKKLRKELDKAFADPLTIPAIAHLRKLPYLAIISLNAVVKEALRLAFPVGSCLLLVCREPLMFKDWVIPPKTPISVNHRNQMINAKVYPKPDEFKPERWFDDNLKEKEDRYFTPWGRGGRMCLGKE